MIPPVTRAPRIGIPHLSGSSGSYLSSARRRAIQAVEKEVALPQLQWERAGRGCRIVDLCPCRRLSLQFPRVGQETGREFKGAIDPRPPSLTGQLPMSSHRVLISDYSWPDVDIERQVLAQADAELVVAPNDDSATLYELAGGVDAIMTCWAAIPAEVIEAVEDCRGVTRLGIGLDNIDVDYCTRQGIPVTNVPDYCLQEVAEHTLALILALARNLGIFHQDTREGIYCRENGPPLQRLEGRTLGLVGLGSIGAISTFWVHRFLGKNFSPYLHIREEHQLVTSGPYRFARHPMYTSLYLLLIGISFLMANWFVFVTQVGVLTVLLINRLPKEEALILEVFGDEYRKYSERVGRFCPFF